MRITMLADSRTFILARRLCVMYNHDLFVEPSELQYINT